MENNQTKTELRQRLEAELARSNRMLSTFNEVLDVLSDDAEAPDAKSRLLAAVTRQFEAAFSIYMRYEPEEQRFWVDTVWPIDEPGLSANPFKAYLIADYKNAYAALVKGEAVVVNLTDPEGRRLFPELAALADQDRFKTCAFKCVRNNDEMFGALMICYRDARVADVRMLDVLDVAARVAETMMSRRIQRERLLAAQREKDLAAATKARILTSLNTGLSAFFNQRLSDESLMALLAAVREHFGADCAFVSRFSLAEEAQSILYRVSREGRQSITTPDQVFPLKNKTFLSMLEREGYFDLQNVADESQMAVLSDWRGFITASNIRAACAAQIRIDNEMWGILGVTFEGDERVHVDEDIEFLRTCARLFGVMIFHRHHRQLLVDANEARRVMVEKLQNSERLLSKALALAEAAKMAESYFVSSISHEIRTPLNAVIGFTELLKDPNLSHGQRAEYLDAVSFSSNALLQLINDVLDLSKLEADRMAISPAPTDLAALCNEVHKVFLFKARENGITMSVECPGIPPLMLDSVRFRQILFNLVGNAVKFTKDGEVAITASFAPDAFNGRTGLLTVAVADTGIGISSDDISKLASPFVQLSRMRGTNAGNAGTGLGLAICKRLAERMNGSLKIESEFGVGSTFTVTMPVNVAEERAAAKSADEAATAHPGSPRLSSRKALVVDDVKMNRMVLAAQLRKIGFSAECIFQAGSGAEALEILGCAKVDIIFTDIWMPEMSGVQLLERIRGNEAWNDVPVIAVTADMEANHKPARHKFDGILIKPITLDGIKSVANIEHPNRAEG